MFFHKDDDLKWYSRIITILILFLLFYYTFKMLTPFLSSLLFAILLAYIFYPVKEWLKKHNLSDNLSSGVILIIVVLILFIPAIFIVQSMVSQTMNLYNNYFKQIDANTIKELLSNNHSITSNLLFPLKEFLQKNSFLYNILIENANNSLKSSANYLIKKSYDILKSIPEIIFQMILILVFLFYFLRDGNKIVDQVFNFIPMKEKYVQKVREELNKLMKGVIFGALMTAIVQGVVATTGYAIIGINGFFLLGILTFIASFVPFIGTGLVWGVGSVVLLLIGIFTGDQTAIIKGISLFLYGAFIIANVDNFSRPYFVEKTVKIHPLIILIGILGGIKVLGFLGVFYGPIIFSLLILFLKISKKEWED